MKRRFFLITCQENQANNNLINLFWYYDTLVGNMDLKCHFMKGSDNAPLALCQAPGWPRPKHPLNVSAEFVFSLFHF